MIYGFRRTRQPEPGQPEREHPERGEPEREQSRREHPERLEQEQEDRRQPEFRPAEAKRTEESRLGYVRPVDDRQPSRLLEGQGSPSTGGTGADSRPKGRMDADSRSTGGTGAGPRLTGRMGADPRPPAKSPRTHEAQVGPASPEQADHPHREKAPARQVLVSEDEVWVQYRASDARDWPSKCAECREAVSLWKNPITPCVNCWKVEVWGSSAALPKEMDWYDLGEAAEAVVSRTSSVIKVSKEPIPVVRSGIPEDGYPDADLDYLLIGYAETISERDALKEALCSALGINPEQANLIPVRRGCWFYDDVLGPWTKWYPIDRDMGEA